MLLNGDLEGQSFLQLILVIVKDFVATDMGITFLIC